MCYEMGGDTWIVICAGTLERHPITRTNLAHNTTFPTHKIEIISDYQTNCD